MIFVILIVSALYNRHQTNFLLQQMRVYADSKSDITWVESPWNTQL